jgi:hypothetical protein
MGRTYRSDGGYEKCKEFWSKILRERDDFGDQEIDSTVMLKLTFEKDGMRIWAD